MRLFKPIFNSFKDFWVDTYVASRGILQHNRLFLLSCLGVVVLLVVLSKPFPTEKVYLSVGQKGSSYDQLGSYLADYFKKYGIDLVKVETSGLEEGLVKLDDDRSAINAGFLTAGRAKPDHFTGLVSLGSIQFSPAWLFYRGKLVSEGDFQKMRIAIGAEGTNTQSIFKAIATARGIELSNNTNLLELKHSEAVRLLNAGKIDALFIVDGFDSPNIQALLADPKNQIHSFSLADAYEKQLPFLKKLTIPKGGLDLATIRPSVNTDILSTTVTLLVENELNPYTQWIFLKAIRDLNNERTHFFAAPDFFPAYLDRSIPLSNVASRYYERGFPALTAYLPWWLAIYLDRVWLYTLAFLAILIPVVNLIPNIRNFYVDSLLNGISNELMAIQEANRHANTSEGHWLLLSSLDQLEARIRESKLPSLDFSAFIKSLKEIKFVRFELEKSLEANSEADPSS